MSEEFTKQRILCMQKLLDFLNGQMNQPALYGNLQSSWFHYLAVILVIIGSIISVTRLKGMDEKKLDKVLIIFSIILLTLELYKQLIFSYQANWDYQWYAFPFQFCSTPMYIALAAGLTKNKVIKEAMISFLATFGLFAGAAVMIYPATVFVQTTGINIQTMVHHGGMTILGVGLLANHVKLKWSSVLKASVVFASLMVIAMVMNGVFNAFIQDGTFNMFFINHKFDNGIPVLMIFQPLVPHIVFLLIYLFGFMLCASIVFGIRYGIDKIDFHKKPVYQRA
jgi:hypothetical protein